MPTNYVSLVETKRDIVISSQVHQNLILMDVVPDYCMERKD